MRGCREVLRLPAGFRERLVRDLLEQILEERVMAALGRARVRLDGQDLLAHERGEERLELRLAQVRQCRQSRLREALAEHGRVLKDAPLLGFEPVETRGHERMERLRY